MIYSLIGFNFAIDNSNLRIFVNNLMKEEI